LVYEVGRLDAPGRPALFATTEEFLRRFGIGSTQNLPVADPVVAAEIRMEVEEELSESGDLIPAEDKKDDNI
ncbi:MAG: SMC-Scp complex subunit ScpB, partial [Hungatella sp.]|nr:SMC-Scp complex subunit ScpB [Hungatella sp.]